MRKIMAIFWLLALLTLTLAGCAEPSGIPGNGASGAVGSGETTADTKQEEHPADYIYEDMSEEEARVRRAADAAMTEKYGITDFSRYDIDVLYNYRGVDGNYGVRYEPMIFGYRTHETYRVELSSDCVVTDIWDNYAGMYSCYLSCVTESMVKQAEEKLDKQVEEYGSHSDYYLSVDEDGYLCLIAEVIVSVTPSVSEDGVVVEDHAHNFFGQRICPKP